jgi:hypothetical protein
MIRIQVIYMILNIYISIFSLDQKTPSAAVFGIIILILQTSFGFDIYKWTRLDQEFMVKTHITILFYS